MESTKTPKTEMKSKTSLLCRLSSWWPALLGPLSMIVVVVCFKTGHEGFYAKGPHETLALILVPIAAISFIYGAVTKRRPLLMVLSGLAVAFFLREWHFAGTSTGIYIALGVLGVWAFIWREKIAVDLQYKLMKVWMFSAFFTYFLSQFTARRALRDLHLPLEHELHVPWEEVLETTAHLMLIVTSIVAWGYVSLKKSETASENGKIIGENEEKRGDFEQEKLA